MHSNQIILSILVPTRNRHDTLPSTLSTLRKSKSHQIEFIVCDNSDKQFDSSEFSSDARFRFIRPDKIAGMSENWEICLSHASGIFRGFVGDDDGVVSINLDNFVHFLRQCSSEVVVAGSATYEWPKHGQSPSMQLIQMHQSNTDISRKILKELHKYKFSMDFPMPYNRAVFSELIERRIRSNNSGNFFNSRTPDINGGALLSIFSNSIESFNQVVFIHGASATSNGDLGKAGKTPSEHSELSSIPFLDVLGDGLNSSSIVQYIEPVLQALALKNQFPPIRTPRVIVRIFFSTFNVAESKSYCLRNWPNQKGFIEVCSILAFIRHKLFWRIQLTKSTWFHLFFNDCTLWSFSPDQIPNVESASLILQNHLSEGRRNKQVVRRRVHSIKHALKMIMN